MGFCFQNHMKIRNNNIMKRLLLLIVLSVFALGSFAQYGSATYIPNKQNPYAQRDNVVPNGNYYATLYYSAHTGHQAVYTLMVQVVNDHVVTIYFENGGTLHEGYNNSGYIWNGGGLSFYRKDGRLVAQTRVVCKRGRDQWQCFDIVIE